MFDYVIQRNGIYYYQRRVPAHLSQVDTRGFIKTSLKTRDPKQARRRAVIHNDYIEEYWRGLSQSEDIHSSEAKYRLAVKLAKVHSFEYKSIVDIASAPFEEFASRVNTAYKADNDRQTVSAVLGGVQPPKLPLSECMDKFWTLCADKLVGKSENQIRKWKNPRRLAFSNFSSVVGKDKSVCSLDRSDALKFKNYLSGKIQNGDLLPSSANKQLIHSKEVLTTIGIDQELDIDFKVMFEDLKFSGKDGSRAPFEADYVQNTFIAGNHLSGLNEEARMLVYAMSDTGARESELIGLREQDIFLNEETPYIWVQPYDGYKLKTTHSERKIPLVGAALYAFQQFPQGFSRYQTSDAASSAINKYFRENNLKPSPRHSLYSLRHTFKDRLRDAGAPEEVIDELMGHRSSGPKYGRGHLLETKYGWLKQIAFKSPST